MEDEIHSILEQFKNEEINLDQAKYQIIGLFDDEQSQPKYKECNCTYMTSGEHAKFCPAYVKPCDCD